MGSKIDSLIELVMSINESNESSVWVLNYLINYEKIIVGES